MSLRGPATSGREVRSALPGVLLGILLAVVAPLFAAFVPATAAPAETDPAVEILSPADGAVLAHREVPWRVLMPATAPRGYYRITSSLGRLDSFVFDGSATEVSGVLARADLLADAENTVTVYHPATGRSTSARFLVTEAPRVFQAVAWPESFTPTLRDGDRDWTYLGFGVNGTASSASAVLSDARGRAVRRWAWRGVGHGDYFSWEWHGKDARGKLLPVGTYTLEVSAGSAVGTDEATRTLRIERPTVALNQPFTRAGDQTSARGSRGRCRSDADGSGTLALDCSGPGATWAEHTYQLPDSADHVRYTLYYVRSCCAPGRMVVTHRWEGRQLVVRVRATRSRRVDWLGSDVRTVASRQLTPTSADALRPGVNARDFLFSRTGPALATRPVRRWPAHRSRILAAAAEAAQGDTQRERRPEPTLDRGAERT